MSFITDALFGSGDADTRPININLPEMRASQQLARQAANIRGGGIRTSRSGGRLAVNASPFRTNLARAQERVLTRAGQNTRQLQRQVRPGFGRLSRITREVFSGARNRVTGNLQDQLARRRLSGSRFAFDTMARAEAEIAQQEEEALSRNFLQEVELSSQLIKQETQERVAAFQSRLNELNLETDVALKLSEAGLGVFGALAQSQAQLAARQAGLQTDASLGAEQNRSNFLTDVIGFGVDRIFGG